MRERYLLHERVELLGVVPHHQVRDVLTRGHIFLNCSLTESFCIAILEAASCGLFVVSTKVGGVPEVLPSSMIKFAEPNVNELVDALAEAISISRRINPMELHERIANMYSWIDVAERTEIIYNKIMKNKKVSFATRLQRYSTSGLFSGLAACFFMTLLFLYHQILEYLWPSREIETCPDIILNGSPRSKVNQTTNDI